MSRWVDIFESHPFQSTWNGLKTLLDKATVDDATIITSVSELARLKKVSSYLDEIIKSIDPELVPITIWDSFNQQANACLQQINMYNSNRNIAHIQTANSHADNLLSYIRPYMIVSGKAGKVLQEAVKSYAKSINEYGESFRSKSNEILEGMRLNSLQSETILGSIEKSNSEIENFARALFVGPEAEGGIEDKINQLVNEIKEKYEAINSYYKVVFVGDTKTLPTQNEIEHAKTKILEDKEEIDNLLEQVSNEVTELSKFYIRIFGEEPKDDDEIREGGLSGELNERIKELGVFEIKQKDRYKALNEQIERLLPGATSAGLATAYFDMKTSFDKPIRNMSFVFYVAIGLLVTVSLFLTIESVGFSAGNYYINLVKTPELDAVLKSVVNKIPFYAPILWLAFYASKRRSEFQRLQQEYAHKEALAKSYDNYKEQLEKLDDKDIEMQKTFIMKAIDAIAYNASSTLDGKHGDKMPALEVIEKVVDEMAKVKKLFKFANKDEEDNKKPV